MTKTAWGRVFAGTTLFLFFCFSSLSAFQNNDPSQGDSLRRLEAGRGEKGAVPASIYFLGTGDYQKALDSLDSDTEATVPWLSAYLAGLMAAWAPLERNESDHFIIFTPPGQSFLKEYALPHLEKTRRHFEKVFHHVSSEKIRVEIYPRQQEFSAASTLSVETLERSGAIGICKFHRLMILSPKSLPLGYRWLDALSHEYMHLMINEVTDSRAELWLHEGTARYFETSPRLVDPAFLTPDQKTKLLDALEQKKFVPFSRMSPSLVYLKDQEEVTLAFAQLSYAVSVLTKDFGIKSFTRFLESLQKTAFREAFQAAFRMSPEDFETFWQDRLAKEKWEKSKGTMSDEVRFSEVSDDSLVGADAQGKTRLGDRMRQRGLFEAALIEYEKALEEEPDNAVILLKAARMRLKQGDNVKAEEWLRRAVLKNPNYGTPFLELARLVEPEEALTLLYEANAINPFNPEIHLLWGEAYEKMGMPAEAEREKLIFKDLLP